LKGFDRQANEQRLETEYPLQSPQGVNAFLSNYHHIRSSAYYKSDYDALNMLIDFEIAFSKVTITDRQRQAVLLVYWHDLTQREAGEFMGISQQAVQQLINAVITKIANQYAADLKGANDRRGSSL